ncbi:hypothetical protein Tco_1318348 [Tanacetum coccineum]
MSQYPRFDQVASSPVEAHMSTSEQRPRLIVAMTISMNGIESSRSRRGWSVFSERLRLESSSLSTAEEVVEVEHEQSQRHHCSRAPDAPDGGGGKPIYIKALLSIRRWSPVVLSNIPTRFQHVPCCPVVLLQQALEQNFLHPIAADCPSHYHGIPQDGIVIQELITKAEIFWRRS